jgi:squalene/oxidosqualene cyclase-like protein
MKSALMLSKSGFGLNDGKPIIDLERLKPTIQLLLNLQNDNGGWASYEKTRGPKWVEKLNPARVFNDIMIEYPYVECTSATIQGLRKFRETHPTHRGSEIETAINGGKDFIKQEQRPDGSWYGSWGVCFTYATWFGVEGLLAAGEPRGSREISKACEFLVSKQNGDGSWGESFESCVKMEYVQHEEGQIINTAWALLALMAAGFESKSAIEKGVWFLLSRQYSNGDFPQEAISGVFNKNCMESYSAYRNVFPLWALGRYSSQLGSITKV